MVDFYLFLRCGRPVLLLIPTALFSGLSQGSPLFGEKHIQHAFNSAPIQVKDLRKYFSQQLGRNGGPTSIKNMLMGHSDDIDSLHYNHQNINDLKQIYDKFMFTNIF